MNRVMHFEIQVDDPERAIAFYTDVFGWKIEEWKGGDVPYWMVMTAEQGSKEPGISGGLLRREAPKPPPKVGANAFVCTVVVEDIDATGRKIEQAGGRLVVPKAAIVGMAWQAYYLDTEGNIFGIHQPDANAK